MSKASRRNKADGITHGLHPKWHVPPWFVNRALAYANGHAFLLKDPCPYCGKRSQSIEHVIPLSQGGSVHFGNKVGACARCNNGRSSQPFLLWMWAHRRPKVLKPPPTPPHSKRIPL